MANVQSLGYIMLHGFTPAINAFSNCDNISPADDKEVNLLLSECGGDARHLLKTIADILPLDKPRRAPINVYVHEK